MNELLLNSTLDETWSNSTLQLLLLQKSCMLQKCFHHDCQMCRSVDWMNAGMQHKQTPYSLALSYMPSKKPVLCVVLLT